MCPLIPHFQQHLFCHSPTLGEGSRLRRTIFYNIFFVIPEGNLYILQSISPTLGEGSRLRRTIFYNIFFGIPEGTAKQRRSQSVSFASPTGSLRE